VRSIGVSNFTPAQIERLFDETGEAPTVNQIEIHPGFAQAETLARDAERLIVDEAWTPLGADLLRNPVIDRLARKHEVTPAQAVLRWHVQRGTVPIPKRGLRLGGDPDSYEEY
jgi:2,5-diketo-D-gluconate reductase A